MTRLLLTLCMAATAVYSGSSSDSSSDSGSVAGSSSDSSDDEDKQLAKLSNKKKAEHFVLNCRDAESCTEIIADDTTLAYQCEPIYDGGYTEAHQLFTTVPDYLLFRSAIKAALPGSAYELRTISEDKKRKTVQAYVVFSGTHTEVPIVSVVPAATFHSTVIDQAHIITFNKKGKIAHLTVIENCGWAMRELGWI